MDKAPHGEQGGQGVKYDGLFGGIRSAGRPTRCRRADGEDDHHGHRSDWDGSIEAGAHEVRRAQEVRPYHPWVDSRLKPAGLTLHPNSVDFHENLRVGCTATQIHAIRLR
ncbi:hypothetical protein Q1695_016346 [Nippostrongylus brasiliensis]|nr:hypothetical protein Q1695_016346 [Nippostrongylus brasiliensis]